MRKKPNKPQPQKASPESARKAHAEMFVAFESAIRSLVAQHKADRAEFVAAIESARQRKVVLCDGDPQRENRVTLIPSEGGANGSIRRDAAGEQADILGPGDSPAGGAEPLRS